jgi:hypothetical protein
VLLIVILCYVKNVMAKVIVYLHVMILNVKFVIKENVRQPVICVIHVNKMVLAFMVALLSFVIVEP